jgi:hypothetical protein
VGERTQTVGGLTGYASVTPFRFADSRTGRRASPLVSGRVQRIQIAGVAGLPGSATAVSANFSVTGQDRQSFLTVYNCTRQVPIVSTLNFARGRAYANQAIVPLDASGGICLYTPANAQVVIDVNGTFSASATGRLVPYDPRRLIDTRDGSPVRRGVTRAVGVMNGTLPGAPASATAVLFNVSAVGAAGRGWVRVFPCDQAGSSAVSTVNFGAGETVANSAMVKLSQTGQVCIQSNTTTDVVLDVTGFITTTGLRYQPVQPVRLIDSRDPLVGSTPLRAGFLVEFLVAGLGGIPATAQAASMNLVAVAPAARGYMTMWPCRVGNDQPPFVSNLNYPQRRNISNGVTVGLAAQAVCLYTRATSHFVVDVSGVWR